MIEYGITNVKLIRQIDDNRSIFSFKYYQESPTYGCIGYALTNGNSWIFALGPNSLAVIEDFINRQPDRFWHPLYKKYAVSSYDQLRLEMIKLLFPRKPIDRLTRFRGILE